MSTCIYCAEALKPSASKCPHCQSYQNWRRHLGFGVSLTTLLIALITVGSFSYKPLLAALSPERGIRVAYVGANSSNYFIFVENIGRMPIVFGHANAFFPNPSGDPNISYGNANTHVLLGADAKDFIVEPQSAKTIALHVRQDLLGRQELELPQSYRLVGHQDCEVTIKFTLADQEFFYEIPHVIKTDTDGDLCDGTYIEFLGGEPISG